MHFLSWEIIFHVWKHDASCVRFGETKDKYFNRSLKSAFWFGSSTYRLHRYWCHIGTGFRYPNLVFTEERIEFVHTAIKPRSVECCSDGYPSVGFAHLHIWSWSSTRVTIRFLVASLDNALLFQLLSLAGRTAKLGRAGCAKLLPLENYGSHCALGNLQCSSFFFRILPQICASMQSCLWALQEVPLTSWLGFRSDMHCQLWGLL